MVTAEWLVIRKKTCRVCSCRNRELAEDMKIWSDCCWGMNLGWLLCREDRSFSQLEKREREKVGRVGSKRR
jgi:hypothetical protein